MALTKREIDAARYNGDGTSWDVRYDGTGGLPGFGVRLFPSGVKSFIVRYRTAEGRQRFYTLGRYGVFTLAQARERARCVLVDVADGKDPLAERQRIARGETFDELAKLYIERHAKTHKKTWREDERRIERHLLPAWRTRKIGTIRRGDVGRLHSKIGADAPYEANRVLALVGVIFTKAEGWGMLPEGAPNPAHGIKPFRERTRERYLTPAEVSRLLKAASAEDGPFVQGAILLYLLTGVRKNELLRLTWDAIDFDRRELRLEDTKAGRPHTVPLSGPAVDILRALPRYAENPHVFPGPRRGQPLKDLRTPWARIRKAAGLEDVRMHDLRRTVGSWLAQSGASLHLIGRVLNHADSATTAVYARLGEDQTRTALEEHGAKVVEVAGKLLVSRAGSAQEVDAPAQSV